MSSMATAVVAVADLGEEDLVGREGVGGKYTPPWGMGPAREVPARAAATARIADFILDGRKY